MNVIAYENNFANKNFKFRKQAKEHSMFYVVSLQTPNRHRYFKVGTTEKTLRERFTMKDYQRYPVVRIMLALELEKKNDCYQLEDLTKAFFRYAKGYTWVKNDRFNYFTLPQEIPLFDTPMHQFGVCKLVKSTSERPAHYTVTIF